jgi:hypothetical protein
LNIISQPAKSSGSKAGALRQEILFGGRYPRDIGEIEEEELEELEDI